MAVVSVEEEPVAREGTWGEDWKRTYTRRWFLRVNDKNDSAYTVIQGMPVRPGTVYSVNGDTDPGAFVRRMSAVCRDDNGLEWVGTAEYGPYDPNQFAQKPTERRLKVNWLSDQVESILDVDKDGAAILNSAGDSYEPALTEERSRPMLQIVRCQRTFNARIAQEFSDAVNSVLWMGADPFTVRCKPITGSLMWDADDGDYWEATYQFMYNAKGWLRKILDAGKREIKVVSGTSHLTPILKGGVPVSDPVPLDGKGKALAVGGTPVVREYHGLPERDFGVLGFTEADIPGLVWD